MADAQVDWEGLVVSIGTKSLTAQRVKLLRTTIEPLVKAAQTVCLILPYDQKRMDAALDRLPKVGG